MSQDYRTGYSAGQQGGAFPTPKPGQSPHQIQQQQIGWYHAQDDKKK